jgi:uncharacterized protein (TIGR00369 family)
MSDIFARRVASNPRDKIAWLEAFKAGAAQTAMGPHQVELVDIGDDFAVLEMPIGDHARQPFGLLHGGISLLLAETAASMHACWGVDLSERVPVGIEVNCSHLSSATDGRIRAAATVLKRGRTLIRHRIDVIHIDSGRLLSEVRVTNLYKTL